MKLCSSHFFLWQQVTSCKLTKVFSCPDTKQKWDMAALKRNCSSNGNCSDYHCVPTETNQIVEVCVKPLYLQGHWHTYFYQLIDNKYKLVLVWNIGLYIIIGVWNSVVYFIVGVCPFFDTVGQRLQMGGVSCLSTNQSESCSARYKSTTVYKCKPSIKYRISSYDYNKKKFCQTKVN